MKASIVTKLWLTIAALVIGVLLVLGVLVTRQMEGLYAFHMADHLIGQARGLVQRYNPDPEAPGDRPWRDLEPVIGARIVTLTRADLAGLARGDAGPLAIGPESAGRLQSGQAVTFRTPGHLFVVGVPLVRDGRPNGALLLVAPGHAVEETIGHFRRILAVAGGVTLAVVTLLALFLSNRLSRPLRNMRAMARALAGGDFRQRVAVVGEDEVGRLGESINRMADTLQATIAQLADNHARLSGILSHMSDAVIVADAEGRCTLLNPPAAALARSAGIACGEVPAVSDWGCLERLGVAPLVREVLAESRAVAQKVRVGKAVFSVHLSPVPDERGYARGAVSVWQDVTHEERLEEMRRDFVANVSHEMRTPIGLVRGYVEALQDGLAESPADRCEMLGIIHAELDRVERLIADLLQLARLDAGQVQLQREPVALGPLAAHLVKKCTPLLEQARVTVKLEIPAELPLAFADPDQVEQVLLNLLENALRHSPPGGTVTLVARESQGDLLVQVQDEGPGIPPEERHLVWERFYRGDPARSRKKGGTGLGLAIVRGIAGAHGGRTWVEAAPGGGSCFCVTFPLAANRAAV